MACAGCAEKRLEKLRRTVNRKVDVVMLRALAPHVKEGIEKDMKLIYEVDQTNEQRAS